MSTKPSLSRLTATQIGALTPGKSKRDVSDPAVQGLVLRVGVSGNKYWLFRFKWKKKTVRISLGAFPAVSLADARASALENRALLDKGIDPRKGKRTRRRVVDVLRETPSTSARTHSAVEPSAQANQSLPRPDEDDKTSVAFLAYEYVEHYVKPNRDAPEYAVRILKKDVLPEWKERDARTITAREVIELLDKIVSRGSRVMANRTADILGQMFKFGVHRSIVEDSPVKLLFKPGGKEKSRKRVLNERELIAFTQKLHKACRSKPKRHVLMLLLLTLQRRSELGLAQWCEFDFDKMIWRIPDERAKNRHGHIVPLTNSAIAELNALKTLSKDSRFVIPSTTKNRPANPKLITRSVARCLKGFKEIGIDPFKPHDLRRTGRTELARLGIPKHVAERLLNHKKENLEGTYDLYEYLDEKRVALERWEQRLLELKEMNLEPATKAASTRTKIRRTGERTKEVRPIPLR